MIKKESKNNDSGFMENPENENQSKNISMISALSLDDEKFMIKRVSVGLQTYVNSESPYISYLLPEDADYVEIIRCRYDTSLVTGTSSVPLVDLELSGFSDAQKAQLYRSNDYFKSAEDNLHCELISPGHAGSSFFDSFAPSGSFRYLIRACVAPARLSHKENLSNRNCSRRVAISTELSSYVNDRKLKEMQALKLSSVYSSRIDTTAQSMKILASQANEAIIQCEERNRRRLVDKKIRDAWLTISAAAIEVGIELVTVRSSLKQTGDKRSMIDYYRDGVINPLNSKQALLDVSQLIGALQGIILAQTFISIFSSSHDLIRTCTRYKRLMDEYALLETSLAHYGFNYNYYFEIVNLAQSEQLVVDGQDLYIPPIENLREFEPVPIVE